LTKSRRESSAWKTR